MRGSDRCRWHRQAGEDRLVRSVEAAAVDDWRAAAWLLERRYPERWVRTARPAEPEAEPGPDGLDDLVGRREARRARA